MIKLPPGSATFPSEPVTVPSEGRFFWPFNFDLGHGLRLLWATAQPVCAADDGRTRTVFFAETPGISAEFAFSNDARVKVSSGKLIQREGHTLVVGVKPSRTGAMRISGSDGGMLQVVLLSDSDSLALWQGVFADRERLSLTRAGLVLDGQQLRLTSTNLDALTVGIYPAPTRVASNGKALGDKTDGVFHRFTPRAPGAVALKASFEQIQPAGPARDIPLGKIKQPVAAAPEDADFEKAAVWRIKLPADLDLTGDPLLRLDYIGDVARVMLNGKLVTDDFYNGRPFEIGLRRHAPEILNGDLQVAILPLRKDAPIYLAKEARPPSGNQPTVAALRGVALVPRYRVELIAR